MLVLGVAVYTLRDGELDRARAECASRDGHTELLHASGPVYICYEVTVDYDGWRRCNASEPRLQVRVETPPQSSEHPCGNAGPRWPSNEPPVEEAMIKDALDDCEAARDRYADYYESAIDEMNRVLAQTEAVDAAAVQSWLSDLAHLFEQNSGQAEAAQASCASGDTLGIYLAISEARDGLDEVWKSIVVGCLTDGIHDCTALAPTTKATCEKRDPEFVYVLDALSLDNWPHSAASGCSLRR